MKEKTHLGNRLLSVLLTFLMQLSLLPAAALAAALAWWKCSTCCSASRAWM